MKHAKLIATLFLVAAGAGTSIAVRADESGRLRDLAAPVVISDAGIGEELVLVAAAPERLAALQAAFGEVEGFYAASAADYHVTGIHAQVSPDVLSLACPTGGGILDRKLDGVLQQIECPLRRSTVRVLRPVDLTFIPKRAYPTYAFPSPCGGAGRPPCQRDRYRELLDAAGNFRLGSRLLVTAFRTQPGAEGFIDLARTLGVDGLVTVSARKLGGGFVGLGQEAHPDGSGPLLHPLPDPTRYQR